MDDYKWFIENYDSIFRKYGHKFLAIKNKKVLGAYNSIREAVDNTKEEAGTFIVQECNGDESGYTNYVSSWNFA